MVQDASGAMVTREESKTVTDEASFPPEIELTEMESLKLTAVSATAAKIIAESRYMELQARTLQQQLQSNQSSLMALADREKSVMAEIAERLGLPHVHSYRMDPATRKGVFQKPQAARPGKPQ